MRFQTAKEARDSTPLIVMEVREMGRRHSSSGKETISGNILLIVNDEREVAAGPSSPYGRLTGIVVGDATVRDHVNDPDNYIRMTYVDHPDVLYKSSGCYVYKRRLPFLEVVRIGKSAPCVFLEKSG
uniref:Uncharacterized protein n=1 Tax=Vitis vinifera TaxID=29760 RepID=A5AN58_VITVI|nr:hypothetical protein VITISV_011664 [Vitis vinifera]